MKLDRLEVREQILDCTRCALHERATAPVPFHGPVPAFIAVLGEGPGREEDEKGRPFVGPAGRLLRETFETVGLDPETMTWMNVTCCWAGVARNPTEDHVKACTPNRELQLELLNPSWLLVFGQSALQAIRPDLTIRRGRGRPFLYGEAVAYGVYHPSFVLRNGLMAQPFQEDLEHFVSILDDGREEWWRHASDRCVECVDYVESYDEYGIGWCRRHLPEVPEVIPPAAVLEVHEAQRLL